MTNLKLAVNSEDLLVTISFFFYVASYLYRKDLLIQNRNARHPKQQGIWLFHTHNTYTHASQ